ncbi:hypothetical protein L0244_18460 [bacterium]|nr:hypothetical protein [bacterium]
MKIAESLSSLLLPGGVKGHPIRGDLIDSLLQSFENCRPGLSDEKIHGNKEEVSKFFVDIYEKELPRLVNTLKVQESFMLNEAREKFFAEIDSLIRTIVIPAYIRLATSYTPRERNDFYLVPQRYHFLERFGWAVAGMFLGVFTVWAPFIPIWSKEWILPFAIVGLVFPNVRKIFSIKRYEADLNRMVAKAESEIDRIEMDYTSQQLMSVTQPDSQNVLDTILHTPESKDTDSRKNREKVKIKGGN